MRTWLGILVLTACGQAAEEVPDSSPPVQGRPDAGPPLVEDAAPPPPVASPARYPTAGLRSPLTPSVAARMREIAARNAGRDPRVFMKVGASGTVSPRLLYCFGGGYRVDLDGRDALQPTIDWFRAGDAAGTSPFSRVTLAAEVGKTAAWAIAGDPSPLEQEIAAVNPRFALVNYGTNDMGAGPSYGVGLVAFHENLSKLLDQLEAEGIVPLVSGLNPRADTATAEQWVPIFDAVTRAMAEERQLPYLSMYAASSALPDLGLISDGIHGNVYFELGDAQPCVFDAAGLQFNYNVRNLESLRLFDDARRAVIGGENGAAGDMPAIAGEGTHERPYLIDRLPFIHAGDSRAGERRFHSYPACDQGQDESGPEIVYQLALEHATPLRIAVLDRTEVDVDAHFLLGDAAEDCQIRHDRVISTLAPGGEARIVVDSFVTGDQELAGRYLLVVLPCEVGDPQCIAP